MDNKTEQIGIRVTEKTKNKLEAIAKRQRKTVTDLMEGSLTNILFPQRLTAKLTRIESADLQKAVDSLRGMLPAQYAKACTSGVVYSRTSDYQEGLVCALLFLDRLNQVKEVVS